MNGELVDIHGQPLRQGMGYSGGGSGFGGQMAEWLPAPESADVALLPSIQLGNARADDLVRNNGIAANAVEIHKDHIVGHMFRLSYRPNWRWLGMSEADSHAFIEDVEAAWMEYCDPVFGSMDVEGRRSFTSAIRYPKHWLEVGDPGCEYTMTQSAPLMVLPDPDAFVVVQVK